MGAKAGRVQPLAEDATHGGPSEQGWNEHSTRDSGSWSTSGTDASQPWCGYQAQLPYNTNTVNVPNVRHVMAA